MPITQQQNFHQQFKLTKQFPVTIAENVQSSRATIQNQFRDYNHNNNFDPIQNHI